MKSKARPGGKPASAAERRFTGLGVSTGIAIGPAHVLERGVEQVQEYRIAASQIDDEIDRFGSAVSRSEKQVRKLRDKARGLSAAAAEELGYLLEAHLMMLSGSRLIRGVEGLIRAERMNAEAAVQGQIAEIAKGFATMDDAYLAARLQDIRDVGRRLIRNLTQQPFQGFGHLSKGTVLVAEELTPADAALMDPARISGFVTALGGAEGHTAIVARSLGLPAVLGVADLYRQVEPGDTLVLDGEEGVVVLRPTAATLAAYDDKRDEWRRERRKLARLGGLPAVTRDGIQIGLQANLELPMEVPPAIEAGAAGIGLLRSEFMFMNRPDLPDEDTQYQAIADVVDAMDGRPVTVRTLDVGGEKTVPALAEHFGETQNPALGLRAIRLSLRMPELLETQFAAMLRASARGPLRIMLPMITTAQEVASARDVLAQTARRLKRRGVEIGDPLPPLGVMIETPAAALAADSLALTAEFFSLGTNDLTQYTLAIDRGNEQVASLYDSLHPAVLRLIQFSIDAGLRAGIPVNLCGEMAGDPRYTALLLGLGLRDLSMSTVNLPRVKRRIRHLNLTSAVHRSRQIMDQHDSAATAELLDRFNDAEDNRKT
jgi:phosphoenolpyruvate-protein phosphotransferase (PTS system enzyme I)